MNGWGKTMPEPTGRHALIQQNWATKRVTALRDATPSDAGDPNVIEHSEKKERMADLVHLSLEYASTGQQRRVSPKHQCMD